MAFPVAAAIGAGITGLGYALANGKDKRQLRQQEKLNDLQVEANDKMLGIQNQHALQFWKDTGYGAQKEQMKEAGINPALMYGMGGGGGQSTGTGSANVGAADAPKGSGREMEDSIGMGIQAAAQLSLIKAQKENIEASTNKLNAETPNVVKTGEKIGVEIQSLTQGIENAKAVEQLTKAQTRMTNLGNELAGRTLEDRIEMVNYETKRACQEAQQAVNDTNVSDATIQDKIKIIKREAIKLLLGNEQIKASTANTEADTKLKSQALEQNVEKLLIDWANMGIAERKLALERAIANGQFEDVTDDVMDKVSNAINNIIMFRSLGSKPGHTPVQGFGKKY